VVWVFGSRLAALRGNERRSGQVVELVRADMRRSSARASCAERGRSWTCSYNGGTVAQQQKRASIAASASINAAAAHFGARFKLPDVQSAVRQRPSSAALFQ